MEDNNRVIANLQDLYTKFADKFIFYAVFHYFVIYTLFKSDLKIGSKFVIFALCYYTITNWYGSVIGVEKWKDMCLSTVHRMTSFVIFNVVFIHYIGLCLEKCDQQMKFFVINHEIIPSSSDCEEKIAQAYYHFASVINIFLFTIFQVETLIRLKRLARHREFGRVMDMLILVSVLFVCVCAVYT